MNMSRLSRRACRLALLFPLLFTGATALGAGAPAEAAHTPRAAPVLAIHGGAGTMFRARLDPEKRADIESTLRAALAAGYVVMERLPALGGTGGVIALDSAGRVAMPFNTSGMYRGLVTADGGIRTAVYRNEDPDVADGAR
jgi:isoaspartyl peptidase/L-asparaginase-like protein (Ntn-hydrolase superfamily)